MRQNVRAISRFADAGEGHSESRHEDVETNDTVWGIKCNIADKHQRAHIGALCWIMEADPSRGLDRVRVWYTHGGGFAKLYISPSRLDNWRASSHLPEPLRDQCLTWLTQESAKTFADRMAKFRASKLARNK